MRLTLSTTRIAKRLCRKTTICDNHKTKGRFAVFCRSMGQASAANISRKNTAGTISHRCAEVFCDNTRTETVERIQKLPFCSPKVITGASAILVSLCIVRGIPSLLFTLRSKDLKNHSGQVCFPGGRCDASDRDVIHSALRETEEEIGVPQSSVDVWAVMPPIGKGLNKPVYPVIGNLGHILVKDLDRNESEVSMIFTVPLEFLCNPSNYRHTYFRKVFDNLQFTYCSPVFLTAPRVWGHTATATELFLSFMFPDLFPKPLGKFFS